MNKIPYWWLSCCLFTTQVFAEPSPAVINPEQLSELPSLDGRVALPTSKAAPGTLTMGDAVNRAVNWHPSIREAVGKLYEQTEEVDVAKSKYYPQVNAGVENGYTHDGDQNGFTPSLVLSLSQMLYDFGKVASQVRAESAGVAQQQANVLVSIDQTANDTAIALVQVQMWQQMLETAKEQLQALDAIGDLTRQRNDVETEAGPAEQRQIAGTGGIGDHRHRRDGREACHPVGAEVFDGPDVCSRNELVQLFPVRANKAAFPTRLLVALALHRIALNCIPGQYRIPMLRQRLSPQFNQLPAHQRVFQTVGAIQIPPAGSYVCAPISQIPTAGYRTGCCWRCHRKRALKFALRTVGPE
jgi:hypothetical protein